MPTVLRILGLDVAAVNSGAAVVEAVVEDGKVPTFRVLEERHLRTERMVGNQPPTWDSMLGVEKQAIYMAKVHGITHVVYEGYAKGSFGGKKKKDGSPGKGSNTTAYEHAELVGIIKHGLHQQGDLVFMQVPVTTLSSFYGLTKGDKNATQRMLKEDLGWVSGQRLKKWREDCSDAAALAIIGCHVFAIINGWDPGDSLAPSKHRVLFGDERKSSPLTGMLYRPHLYIPRDACVVLEEEDDDESQG